MGAEIILQPREIQDPLQIERIIHVQMNPEQRILIIHEHLPVEGLIFLLRAVRGLFQPEGSGIVDLLGLRQLHHLFGFRRPVLVLLISEGNFLLHRFGVHILQHDRISHIAAVPVQHLPGTPELQEFLLLLADMEDDIRPVLLAAAFGNLISHTVLRHPVHRLRPVRAGQALDLHLFADHEDGIEAQAEVADNIRLLLRLPVLKLLHKLRRPGEGHLINILPDLIRRHADARIRDPDDLLFLIHGDRYPHFLSGIRMQHPEFGDRVTPVGHRFPQKNILI